MSNPFLVQDINTIIDAFADPVDPGEPTVGQAVFSGIVNFPDWFKAYDWGSGSIAMASNDLQQQMDDAKSSIDALYGYGTANKPAVMRDLNMGLVVQGVNIQNTWHTIANSGTVGEAMMTAFADCVPCKDRILALLAVNPIEDLMSVFSRSYERMMNFVVRLFDLIIGDHSVQVFADFCSLLKFLNFMCVPDLARMLIILSNLVTKYTIKLKDLEVTFAAILGRLMGPALTPLASLLDKYIQLIIAPIECVITSLDAQLHSLDVVQAWKKGFGKDEDAERTFSLNAVAGPLQSLKKYLTDAADEVKFEFEKLQKNIDDWLSFMDERDKRLFDVATHINNVAKLIGVIQAVILAIQQGIVVCGPKEGTTEESLGGFFNNYIGPNFSVDISIKDGNAYIQQQVPEGLDKLIRAVATYKKEQKNKDLPSTAESKVPEADIGRIVVPLRNCLYSVTDNELAKVKDLLGSFQEGGA